MKNSRFEYLLLCCVSGSSEMLMAHAVRDLATQTPGKESMAIEAFAHALTQVTNLKVSNHDIFSGNVYSTHTNTNDVSFTHCCQKT